MEFDYRTGDCRELLKTVPDASVRLVVTSPPYNIGKSYGKYKDKIALNDWQDLINDTTKEVCRILTPDGAFFLNLSPVPLGSSKEIIPLPFLGYQIFKDNGLYLRNMITWTFNNMQNCISYYNASTAANAYGSGAADDEKTESYINHRLNCIFKDFLLIYKHQETERRL